MSKEYREPPSLWLRPDEKPGWSREDRVITLAYAIYQRDYMCPSCGGPKALCRERDGYFQVVPEICHAQKAIDQWQENRRKQDPEPGQVLTLTSVGGAGEEEQFVFFDDEKP